MPPALRVLGNLRFEISAYASLGHIVATECRLLQIEAALIEAAAIELLDLLPRPFVVFLPQHLHEANLCHVI